MKNFVQIGDTLPFTAPYAVAAGAGFQVGALFAVAVNAAANGAPVQGNLTGVYELAKAGSQAWSVGAVLYWDNAAKNCTTTAGSNLKIGHVSEAAASSALVGKVRLNGAY